MWQEVENRKADETRIEKAERKRGEERKEEYLDTIWIEYYLNLQR